MKVGGRRELIIPASLGYGTRRQSGIPANSALVFVIDLHGVSSGVVVVAAALVGVADSPRRAGAARYSGTGPDTPLRR